ncbi:helicase [Actinomyces viscosus]|uniref:N-formylmethionyl-tRNA deformylase n=1 Tax=Actinomyces viscosus TaxID=1656 RepID=A0A448PNI2_ACTVI|nr:DEAD/DEAH box helicase [Actinomyces viscosus]TFH51818.1 helicase [Actinomyces viscosus]VEI17935.1 N-formylmethionyl-tRNA deformylase [Actinomyces viscosus]
MARDVRHDDWPVELTDDRIINRVGHRAFLRGLDYARKGRVRGVGVAAGGDIISAQIKGSGARTYQTMVFRSASSGPRRPAWTDSCSCPVGSSCKHVAALLITVRALAKEEPDGDAAVPRSTWEGQLAGLLQVERAPRRRMALEIVDDPGSMWGTPPGPSMLPLIEGKRGWNRQGASWSQVASGGLDDEVDPDVISVLRELAGMADGFGFYYADDRVSLVSAPARVWEVLRRGIAAGLTLTTAQRHGQPVYLAEGLRGGVHLIRDDDGGVVVTPALEIDNVEEINRLQVPGLELNLALMPLGDPVHGFYTWMPGRELLLMPIEPRPTEALSRVLRGEGDSIVIPAQDVGRFENEHLEALTRALPVLSADASIRMPRPTTPRAALAVHVDADEHHLTTEWMIRYVCEDGEVRHAHGVGDLAAAAEGRIEGELAGRDAEGETRLAREILNHLLPLAGQHPAVWRPLDLRGMDTARFMTQTLPVLREMEAFDVEVDDDVPAYREAADAPVITTSVDDDEDRPDWFSLSVRVHVGDEEIPISRLMAALAVGEREVLLESGTWVSIDRPEIEALARLMEEGRELADPEAHGTLRVSALHAGYYEVLESLGVIERATARWKERVGRLLERARAAEAAAEHADGSAAGTDDAGPGETAGEVAVPEGMRARLRPYQLEGYRWLDFLRQAGLGGVLADDMGLGKTVQVLAAVQRLVEERERAGHGAGAGVGNDVGSDGAGADDPGDVAEADAAGATGSADGADGADESEESRGGGEVSAADEPAGTGPVLVIAPTSVVGSWVEQAERFCPGLRVRAVTRTAAKREESLDQIAAGCDVVVTSYTIARLCEEEFIAQDWAWVVCDEAQFVKNHTSATYKAVRQLRAPSTIAITGTPLENSLMDLWALMSIAAPGLLPDPERFGQVYRKPIDRGDAEALGRLRRRMRPFLLRRTKEQVAADLPAKTEQVLSVELGAKHRKAYDQRLARERQRILGLLEEDTAQSRFIALKALTTLRQMALDPALVDGGDEAAAGDAEVAGQAVGGSGGSAKKPARGGKGAKGKTGAKGKASAALSGSGAGQRRPGRRPSPSAKVEVLLEHLGPIVSEGHRALIFSQFTRYLSGVREHLEAAGVRTAYMDGATSNRQEVIDAFRAGEADVFLISLKAGGFGLTLTEADYVFLLDPWWNPQAEEQAVDRTHRIGQDKPVLVYRLVSADTIEEKVMALKEKKAELFARVVEGASDVEAGVTGAEGAAGTDGAAGVRGTGGLSPAALTPAEIRELIEG